MSDNSYTTIRLKRETVEILKEIGKKSETYDDVISRLIEEREEARVEVKDDMGETSNAEH